MSNWFYYDSNAQKQGPYTSAQFKELAKQGVVTPDTMIETDEGKTAPARRMKGLTFAHAVQPQAPPQPPAAVPPPALTNFFYLDKNNQKHGPVNNEQLKTLAAQGVINPNTPLMTDAGQKGRAGQIPGLFVAPAAPNPFTDPEPSLALHYVPDTYTQTGATDEQLQTGGGKAVRSLVYGIISVLTCGGFLILPLIGLLIGFLGLKSNKRGIAITGLCLNGVSLIIPLVVCLLYVVPAALETAKRTPCSNNLKRIMLAFHDYHEERNVFPPLYTTDFNLERLTIKPLHSWRVLILPYIGHAELYDAIRLDEPWDSEYNKQFHDKMPSIYQCPSNPNKGCCYVVIEGILTPSTGTNIASMQRGLSNTLALVEVRDSFNWMDPEADIGLRDLEQGINAGGRVGSYHVNGMNAAFMDISVVFLTNDTPSEELRNWGTRN